MRLLALLLAMIVISALGAQDPWRGQPAEPLLADPVIADPLGPGRAPALAAATPLALEVHWGDAEFPVYSEIVIQEMDAALSLATVLTWTAGDDDPWQRFQIGYVTTAYRDANGAVHINARGASLRGPEADHWWPDSFMIDPQAGGAVQVLDDAGNEGEGVVKRRYDRDDKGFTQARLRAQLYLTLSL